MYTFNSRVRYSETDTDELLSLPGIINYMQDCATFHSEDCSRGIDDLEARNLCWILNSWQVIIERRPKYGEEITIGTNAYAYKGMCGFRNFIIDDRMGNRCAYGNSVWILVNSETYKPVKVTEEAMIGLNSSEKLDMEYADRKITVPISLISHEPIKVLHSHLDSHLHVNNGKYISIAMDYLPKNIKIRQLRVQYLKTAVIEDIIIPKTGQLNDKYYISLNGTDDSPFAVLEFQLTN